MGALIIRVTWKPYSMYKSRCMSSPLLMCKLPWGHQETKAQPMPEYISQALSFDSAETGRTRGKSKIRNETPIPKARVSKKLTTHEERELLAGRRFYPDGVPDSATH
jgi:hypothetical protein